MRSSSSSRSAAVAGEDDPAAREHDDAIGEPADDVEVLLDEEDRNGSCRLGEGCGDLVDDARRQALRRLVDEEEPVLVDERPRERDHLLLPAREGAGALRAAVVDVGEELRDEVAARPVVALGEPEVLGDGQRAEDLAVLGHVADASLHDAVRRKPVDARAGEAHFAASLDEPEDRPDRRRLADAVAAEQGGDAGGRDLERDVLDDLLAGDAPREAVDDEDRLAHTASPR